jgi:hypothetical protein
MTSHAGGRPAAPMIRGGPDRRTRPDSIEDVL